MSIFRSCISLCSKPVSKPRVNDLSDRTDKPRQRRKRPDDSQSENPNAQPYDYFIPDKSTHEGHIIVFGMPSICKSVFLNAAIGSKTFPLTTKFPFENALVKGSIPPFYTVKRNGVTFSNVLCLDNPLALPRITAHFAEILRAGGTFKLFYVVETQRTNGLLVQYSRISEFMRNLEELLRSVGCEHPHPWTVIVYAVGKAAKDYDSDEDILHPKMVSFVHQLISCGPFVEIEIEDKKWKKLVSTPAHIISHGNDCVKEKVRNATQVKIAPIDPIQERQSRGVGVAQKNFAVFVSHAGPDKESIAIPLKQELEARGVSTFVDEHELKAGYESAAVMEDAMECVPVGVFILSPEFAMRKWPMKELRCFLKRVERAKGGQGVAPTIIPVFYRLTVESCRDGRFYDHDQETGVAAFRAGFFDDTEIEKEEALKCLADVASFAGIRNDSNVKNKEESNQEEADFERVKREAFVEVLAEEIAAAAKRRLDGEEDNAEIVRRAISHELR